jgi:hypothetical protein
MHGPINVKYYVELASSRWQHVELYGGPAAMRLDNAH